MNLKRMYVLFFSPTGGTEKIARAASEKLAADLKLEQTFIDFTKLENRQAEYHFQSDDLLVMASPVYAGRLPNKLMPAYKAKIYGDNTPAIPICVFGNRSPGEALRELVLLLEGNGFQIAAGAAFACRHAFSDKIGAGRPDKTDLAQIREFADKTAKKLSGAELPRFEIDRSEIGPYYIPKKEDGTPAKFLKAKPVTDWTKCVHCGLCAQVCPLGSIDQETMETTGLCIKCQACVRSCPKNAKYFEDVEFLSHVAMLEQHCAERARNVVLI